MKLCSKNHEEVCFESSYCPMCELLFELNRELEKKEGEISGLKYEISQMEG